MNTRIIEKLTKLIKHEESAREIGSLNEASAFAAQIQNLLTAHSLSMSDIEIQEEVNTDERVESEVVKPDKAIRKMVRWQIILLKGIASANSCHTLVTRGSNYQHVVGLSNDRQTTMTLYYYFLQLAQDLCAKAFVGHKTTGEYQKILQYSRSAGETAAHSREWKTSWLQGFAQSISNRLYETKRDAVKVAEQEAQASNALVHLRDKEAAVREFIDNGDFSTIRQRESNINHGAYSSGRSAGERVALSGGALKSSNAERLN